MALNDGNINSTGKIAIYENQTIDQMRVDRYMFMLVAVGGFPLDSFRRKGLGGVQMIEDIENSHI
jgi:hypothetical protein